MHAGEYLIIRCKSALDLFKRGAKTDLIVTLALIYSPNLCAVKMAESTDSVVTSNGML